MPVVSVKPPFTNISSTPGEVFTRASASRGAAFGDLDNDGDVGVVIANCNGPATVLRNDGGNANHWIAVDLTKTEPLCPFVPLR